MFPRVRPRIPNTIGFIILAGFLLGMIYSLGLIISGLAILAGFPKPPFWALVLLGILGVAAMVALASLFSKLGYFRLVRPWYYRLPLSFAGYLVGWLGFELYFYGLERLDVVSVFMFAAIMACAMTFIQPRNRTKLAG